MFEQAASTLAGMIAGSAPARPPAEPRSDARFYARWALLVIAPLAVALVAFGPYLDDYFVQDDWIWMRESSDGGFWTVVGHAFTFPDATDFATPTPFFRPLADIVLKVMYDVFGLTPEPYHGMNLLLHAAAAALGGALIVRLGAAYWAALAAAILFASAPQFQTAVVWISQAPELLSVSLSLLTLHLTLSYLREERAERARVWLTLAAASLALALLAKQSSAVVLALLPLLALTASGRRRTRTELTVAAAMAIAIATSYAVIALVEQDQDMDAHNAVQRDLSTQIDHLADYAGRLVWPFAGGRAIRISLAVLYAALGGFLIATGRRVPAFFFAWSILALLPFTAVFGPAQWRYTYAATFPFFACLAVTASDLSAAILSETRGMVAGVIAIAAAVALAIGWIPSTRDGLRMLAVQAERHEAAERLIRAQCGDLPPGGSVYLAGIILFDPFDRTTTELVNTIYDDVYYREGEPPADPVGDPVCAVRAEGAAP
jgi:hypothetical protein